MDQEKLHLKIDNYLLKNKRQAWEDLFTDIMRAKHGIAFQPVKAHGRMGDKAADGVLRKDEKTTVFQCHAPDGTFEIHGLLKKMRGNFDRAFAFWKMNEWIYVHNQEGLPPPAVTLLHDLHDEHPDTETGEWGFEDVRKLALEIPEADQRRIFDINDASAGESLLHVRHEDIARILEALSEKVVNQPIDQDFSPEKPTEQKLYANDLTEVLQQTLRLAMAGSPQVGDVIQSQNLEQIDTPDQLARILNRKYKSLKAEGYAGDLLYKELKREILGDKRRAPAMEHAADMVLAFYFQTCDIYEEA